MFSQSDIFCYRIGPEPTTDAFTAVMYGENEQASLFRHFLIVLNWNFMLPFLQSDKKNIYASLFLILLFNQLQVQFVGLNLPKRTFLGDSRKCFGSRQVSAISTSHQVWWSLPQQVAFFIPSLPLIKLCPDSNARLSRAQCWSVWQWSTPLESSLERNNELTEVTISSASSSGSLKEWTGDGLLLSFVIMIFPTQDRASLWREQVGHLGRVPPFDRGDPWLRRQSQDCLEQGRPGEDGDWNTHLNVQINEDMNLTHSEQVDHQELMRVYGALMWSISKVRHFRPQGAHFSTLGCSSKVINVPECPKIYVGSFWDQQLKHDLYRRLFEKELQSLFDDLQDLPR